MPSNAASLTSNPSTDATSRAQLVRITLPSTRCRVEPSVKVLNAAMAVIMFIEMLELEPITSITGNVRVVKLPIVAGAILPPVNTVRARSTPTLVKAGADMVTSAAIVAGLKLPPTYASTGIEKVVREAIELGEKLVPTNVSAGADNVGNNAIEEGAKEPLEITPTPCRTGIDRVVSEAIVLGPKLAPINTSAGAEKVVSVAKRFGLKAASTFTSEGIDRVVSVGIVLKLKFPPRKLKTGKLIEVKLGADGSVKLVRIPAKLEKVNVVDGITRKIKLSTITPSETVKVDPACAPDLAETIAPNGGGAIPV